MLSFHDAASVAASPAAVSNPHLQQLLTDAVIHWQAAGLLELTHLLIIQPGDTGDAFVEEVGFSPLVNPLDGSRFGGPSFTPYHDDLQDRCGWFELTVTVGNSGFAFVLFIQDAEGVNPELLSLCRTFVGGAAPCSGF
jgi:hypothetical protein